MVGTDSILYSSLKWFWAGNFHLRDDKREEEDDDDDDEGDDDDDDPLAFAFTLVLVLQFRCGLILKGMGEERRKGLE
jgi:hypothetical protein